MPMESTSGVHAMVQVITWLSLRPDFCQQCAELVRIVVNRTAVASKRDPFEVHLDMTEPVFLPAYAVLYDTLREGMISTGDPDQAEMVALSAFAECLTRRSQVYLNAY